MDHIQNFNKGINKDITQVNQPEGSYVDALNIELINDELQGSVAISNSQGNKLQLSIPDVDNIYRITIINFTAPNASTITINGNTSASFVTSTSTTGLDLYNFIVADAVLGPAVGVDFNVYYNDFSVVVVPIAAATLTLSVAISAGTGCLERVITVPANSTSILPIGYAVLRDDIYIFSTPCFDEDPQTNGGGYGYIWKFTYDNIAFAPNNTGTYIAGLANLELIYAGDINFTTWYNIPQTGVVTRYENDLIKRIYWTDNYNRLRSINVAQDQLFAMDTSLLDVVPAVDFDIPIMTAIGPAPGTASVRPGCWQMAYRLKKNNGAVTAFSPLSNMVFITVGNEQSMQGAPGGTAWLTYRGDAQGVSLTKQVTWTINNVDVDYDTIEFCLARRSDKNDPGTYFIYDEQTLSSSATITTTIDGDLLQTAAPLTLSEFLTMSIPFTHCKTIATKDNRLVAANVKNKIATLDYDARAYRFDPTQTNADIVENGAVTSLPSAGLSATGTYPITGWDVIAEDSDAIGVANLDPYGGGFYDGTMLYNLNGNIGGSGPNIEYEFICIATAADKFSSAFTQGSPNLLRTDSDYTLGQEIDLGVDSYAFDGSVTNQTYTREYPGEIMAGIKFPPFNSVLIGYQNNETYRFGIQFYDKSKNPYFVKWIGDIKFPDVNDTCPAANNMFPDGTPTGETDYGRLFTDTQNNQVFVTQLGIKFTVNIPAELTEKISGYSIVRVEREEDDKQVISEGLLKSAVYSTGGSVTTGWYKEAITNSPGTPDDFKYFYYSPNILDNSLKQPEAGHRLIITNSSASVDANLQGSASGTFPGPIDTYASKIYAQSAGTLDTVLNSVVFCAGGINFTDGGDYIANTSDQNDVGNNNYYFKLNDSLTPGFHFGYVYVYKSNQYGGNTFVERADNTYVRCSHFRPIRNSVITITDTFYGYGGDVTNGIMDETMMSGNYTSGAPATTWGYYFPSKSPVNRELRHGAHFNFSATGNVNVNWDYRDTYEYNTCYSCQDNIVKYYPEPASFNNTEIFDNRFYISEIKINGESQDSWGIFLPNNYWDAEGTYGPINSMLPLNDKMYFWQDKAFGIIQINPRAVVTDTNAVNNAELQIGTGLPLQRHDYITVNAGTKHQGSTLASYGKLYWYDANTFKMWVFNPGGGLQPLSDVKGLYSYFTKYLNTNIQNYDKPTCALDEVVAPIGFGLNGVVAVYDNRHQRVLYTFHTSKSPNIQKSFTIAINELTDCITSFYSFTPRVMMGDGKQVFSFDTADLYVHNQGEYNNFYGVLYDSYVKFIVNPNSNLTKVFDNFVWDSQATKYVSTTDSYQNYNDITFTHVRVTNDYQNTDKQALTNNSNIKRKERSWQLDVPRNRVLYTSSNSPNIYTDLSATEKQFGERIRDKYAQVELWFTNTASNYQLKLNNFITQFRQSSR